MNRPRRDPKPTWTRLAQDAMEAADDFLTRPQLQAMTGASSNQMGAVLAHMKKCGAADCLESGGQLWWFLTGRDSRSFIVDQRTPEEPGTRKRQRRAGHLTLVPTGAP